MIPLGPTRRALAWAGLALGVAAVGAAWAFSPVEGRTDALDVLGLPFRHTCSFRAVTGVPCASCGMTRAWVWAVRGELGEAWRYNAAGALLFLGVVGNGAAQGAWLALGRAPRREAVAYAGIGALWVVGWLGSWGARLAGAYPLP